MTWLKKDGVSDADLIAAARDMYEALEFLELALSHRVEARTAEALQRRAGIALAKARGEG